ncbi:MAG: TetR/AcrR family transcriptional regulator [Deltaproteobacteria bacterium]|nr:TetR/AcrR family transcriptional regulator [Deltaproteobacteria bacterium]
MSIRAEQKSRSREGILDAAARLVRERGIAGARVADVMQGAGLTVGAFYAHFASKEQLVDEALRRTSRALRERLLSRLDEKPAADRAEVVLKRYLCAANRDEQTLGCPFPAVVGEIATTAPEHGPVLGEQVEELREALAEHLPKERRHLALGLVALMIGGLSLARALRGTPLSDDVLKSCRALGAAITKG